MYGATQRGLPVTRSLVWRTKPLTNTAKTCAGICSSESSASSHFSCVCLNSPSSLSLTWAAVTGLKAPPPDNPGQLIVTATFIGSQGYTMHLSFWGAISQPTSYLLHFSCFLKLNLRLKLGTPILLTVMAPPYQGALWRGRVPRRGEPLASW